MRCGRKPPAAGELERGGRLMRVRANLVEREGELRRLVRFSSGPGRRGARCPFQNASRSPRGLCCRAGTVQLEPSRPDAFFGRRLGWISITPRSRPAGRTASSLRKDGWHAHVHARIARFGRVAAEGF